jgi:hypothetical protein
VADAVLYEGYVLYPYRASSQKNQLRWQFGVLTPPAYVDRDPSESAYCTTECLLEGPAETEVHVLLRFLQVQRRYVDGLDSSGATTAVSSLEVDGVPVTPWDEAVEQEIAADCSLKELMSGKQVVGFHVAADEAVEPVRHGQEVVGMLTRLREPLRGRLLLSAEQLDGPYGVSRLTITVENCWPGRIEPMTRDAALLHSLVAAHTIIRAPGAAFLSMTDSPEWASPYVDGCVNVGTWPVLVGPADVSDTVLSSPIILGDRPQLAPESAGVLYDGTEIDEILTLRTMALTDAERLEVRGTDPRAAALLDGIDDMPPELMERLHGTIRYLRTVTGEASAPAPLELATQDPDNVPWWSPGADTSVSPGTDEVVVDGVPLSKGSRVLLDPGRRRADAQDIFLTGRVATVEAVLHDVDGRLHLAVTLVDDEAADLQRAEGRFLYFAPDEVHPLGPQP